MNLYGQTYDQIVKHALAGSSKHFQLVYPFQDWTWPTPPRGFIDPQAYRFVGQVPHWSAIGRYVPGGNELHEAYLQVLSLPDALGDGVNEEQLKEANEHVIRTRDKLQEDKRIANAAYSSYRKATPAGTPVQEYDSWLAENWGPTFAENEEAYLDTIEAFSLILDQKNPGLKDAIDAAMPPVKTNKPKVGFAQVRAGASIGRFPNYIIPDSKEWLDQVVSEDGGVGMTIEISASKSSDGFSKCWAGDVDCNFGSFFEVHEGRSNAWEGLDLETEDKSLNVTVNITAYNNFPVSPDPSWFNSGLLAILAFRNDWNPPFSTTGGDSKQAVFGKHGVLPLMVTGLVVGYQPIIEITMTDATHKKYKERFDACDGIRIGPFQFGGGNGHTEDKWSKSSERNVFKIESKATYPFIMGITVASPGL